MKRCAYRLGTQHFSNVYYFDTPIAATNLTDLELLVDEVVAKEKAVFSTAVTFVQGRLWSQIGTPTQNNMLIDKTLSGTGALGSHADMDRERAFLIRLRAGVDSRGRPVYLRKYYHLLVGIIGGAAISGAMLAQTAELSSGQRTALEVFMNSLASFTVNGQSVNLVSKNGRGITGSTQAHRFLEHRQLGDEWRGQ
jgi:hypothetical protein